MAINSFNNYLHTDYSVINQPEGTYRFALNVNYDSESASLSGIPNELGNTLKLLLPVGQSLIGYCLTNTNDVVIFSAGVTSEIGLYNSNTNLYTTLIQTPDLNFSLNNPPVDCLFRNRKGCDRTIYFTDRVNSYRSINLDLLSQYQDDAGNWVVDRFALTPNYVVPKIELNNVSDSGGALTIGAYFFSIRYLDRDLNPSNYFIPTDPIYIYDENIGSVYSGINGGSPLASEEGGVATTTKSIILNISNLDQDQRYYQISVSHVISATGNVSNTYLTPPRFIYGTNDTFIYAENDETQDIIASLDDIIVDNELIEVVQAHAQTDNTLFLANLSSKQYDYSKFQEVANSIGVNYTTKKVDPYDQLSIYNNKSPLYVRSLMGDEVYALSVEFLFKSGATSPAFHIPGRSALSSDRVNVLPSLETKHLLSKSSYELWEVKNTGSTSQMGYHESIVPYPDIENCNGGRIYPEGFIRHHRLPCRSIVPVHDATSVYPIGLIFNNVSYPHPDIVGHRFLVAIRSEGNSTVIDAGITIDLATEANLDTTSDRTLFKTEFQGLGFTNGRSTHKETVVLSPKNLINKQTMSVSHIKFNYKLNESLSSNKETKYNKDGGGKFKVSTTTKEFQTGTTNLNFTNRVVDGNIYIDSTKYQKAIQGFENDLQNSSETNLFNFFHFIDDVPVTGYSYVTLKQQKDVYNSLESILYRPLHHNFLTLSDSQEVFGGDTFISELIVTDIPFYRNSDHKANCDLIQKVWVESSLNYGMVYAGTSDCNSRYETGNPNDYFIGKIAHLQEDGDYILRGSFCQEYYGYNRDFNYLPTIKTNIGIPYVFNYCSDCLNTYPFQVRYSKTSYLEETIDNYKIFLSNNAKSLDGSSGDINKLFVDKDQLYASTAKDIIFLTTRPQSLNTDSSVIYLGTGEKLSVPAKKLVSIPQGYSGTEDYNSFVNTQYGTFYVSSNTGKVIKLSSELKEISMEGMNTFFKNSLRYNLEDYFSNYDLKNRPYNVNGTGVICGFDPRYDRLIIHKRDYKPLFKTTTTPTENRLHYSNGKFYYTINLFTQEVKLTDPKYFEDKSFTIAYNAKANKWLSFYSYYPDYFIHDSENMYTTKNNGMHKHQEGLYCQFYGKFYTSQVEFVVKSPLSPMVFSNIQISMDGPFYSRVWAHNSYQSTGYQDIIQKTDSNPFVTVTDTSSSVIAQKVDSIWRLSNFRDMSTSNIVTSDSWIDTQSEYYTDIVPINVDYNKTLFQAARLRDEYLRIRLVNKSSNKVTLNYINTNQEQSFR